MSNEARCGICGEPMPAGEEMFTYHGYSGPCPKPPLPAETPIDWQARALKAAEALIQAEEYTEYLERKVKWHPIETAPNDWTGVLVYRATAESDYELWGIDRRVPSKYFGRWAHSSSDHQPTHWMPLPDKPGG